jgi:uncharacterized repeat protein (TIGR02543 family)
MIKTKARHENGGEMKKARRVKLCLMALMFAVFGLSIFFSEQAHAQEGRIYFHINYPGTGGKFIQSSLLPGDQLLDNGQTVLRVTEDRRSTNVGMVPKFLGKPGFQRIYTGEWNSNPERGGGLYTDAFIAARPFDQLFPSLGVTTNIGHYYVLWTTKSDDKVTITYDSNSDREVPNPPDRPGKIAGEKFTADELKSPGKRYGYDFDAWYSEPGHKLGTRNDTTATKNNRITPVDADPSIYSGTTDTAQLVKTILPLKAEWIKKSGNVKVEFRDIDGTLYSTINAIDIWDSLALAGYKPLKEGYRLTGWYTPDGQTVGGDEIRTPASMDINLSPGGTLRLYAQWKAQSKLTINYLDRDFNSLGRPSIAEMIDSDSNWMWNTSYELTPPVTEKIFAAYRVNNGNVIERAPTTIAMTQNTVLDLIYGQDKVGPGSSPGSDGIEDFDIERSWEQEDGSSVSASLTAKVMALNRGETFNKDYAYDCDADQFKSFEYLGYYLKQDKSTLLTGTPSFTVSEKTQVTYVFRKITYDLRIHYVDMKGQALTPSTKLLSKEIVESQDYLIEPSKLDDFDGMAPVGWYLGAPSSGPVSPSDLREMSTALKVEYVGKPEKTEAVITIVHDHLISVTLPLTMKFVVTNEGTRAVSSENYTITNNSASSRVSLKLDTAVDVKVNKNDSGISLISAPRTDNVRTEELYLALKSDLSGFGEQTLAANGSTVSTELAAAQSMNITLAGKYHGVIPDEKSAQKEFEGQLIWHFTPKPGK